MKKTYIKVIYREIKYSLSRFLAIFAIVALGVGFLAGLMATTPDMTISADTYYDDNDLMDIKILSTMGLTDDDLEVIRNIDGVEKIMQAYSADIIMKTPSNDTLVTRIHSIPKENDHLNKVILVDGRMPEKVGECLIDAKSSDILIGDVIKTLPEENIDIEDKLKTMDYTVVGIAKNPYYMSMEREPSTVGNGKIGLIMYTGEENFSFDVYTEIYLTLKDSKDMIAYSKKYNNFINEYIDKIKPIGKVQEKTRYNNIVNEATLKLDEAKTEYNYKKLEAETKLADALKTIEDAKVEILDAEKKLADSKKLIIENEQKLKDGKIDLEKGIQELAYNRETYNQQIKDKEAVISSNKKLINDAKNTLSKSKAQLDANKDNIDAAKAMIASGVVLPDEVMAQIKIYDNGLAQYNAGMKEVLQNENELESGEISLETAKKEALAKFAEADKKIADSRVELVDGEKKLVDGKADVLDGEKKLGDAKIELSNGENEYNTNKIEVDEKFSDANKEILDAEQKIVDIEMPEWFILDRTSILSYSDFESNTSKIKAISAVFPIFFFLVAALVALTTMTRMVEEERTQIGTLKALGYNKNAIMFKYIFYAGIASLLGSICGLLVGFKLFPTVIWNAYGIMYFLPPIITQFNVQIALISTLVALACTMIATVSACSSVLIEHPAKLMLPRVPKAGKRIFLEKIKPIWSHLTFTHKVTARNLIRYKKRFFMTVIGIAGCTALLVTGFGLRDSIGDIIFKQFEEIYTYNLNVGLKETNAEKNDPIIKSIVEDKSIVSDYVSTHQENGTAMSGKDNVSITIYVPNNIEKMKNFINLRERKSGKQVFLEENKVVVTEKLAETLKLKIGSKFNIKNNGDDVKEFTVGGIVENYLTGYVYMTPNTYTSAYSTIPEYKSLSVKTVDDSEEKNDLISTNLLKSDSASFAQFNDSITTTFQNMIKNIDYIIVVLIVCAGLLAFVVLYNLTNINITERQKEIATIKVLGFFDNEVSAYIYRETAILSVIGTICGLILGIFLHAFVVKTAEIDDIMFGREIKVFSYIISAILTLLFSLLVNLVMYRKLKNINMVESMKSGE